MAHSRLVRARSAVAAVTSVLLLTAPAGCTAGSSSGPGTTSPAPTASELDRVTAAAREAVRSYADLLTGAVVVVRVGGQTRTIAIGRRASDRPLR